jgi:hypothetical protein
MMIRERPIVVAEPRTLIGESPIRIAEALTTIADRRTV